jgi:hypothetical protein
MEPIAEPPQRAQPRRPRPRAVAAPAPAPARGRAARRPRGFKRALRTLLLLVLLIGIGAGAYVLATQSEQRGAQLRERVEGDVDRAVDEIQGLIEDNTR